MSKNRVKKSKFWSKIDIHVTNRNLAKHRIIENQKNTGLGIGLGRFMGSNFVQKFDRPKKRPVICLCQNLSDGSFFGKIYTTVRSLKVFLGRCICEISDATDVDP